MEGRQTSIWANGKFFRLTQKNLPRWLGNITGSGWKPSQVEAMLLKTAWAAWTNVERTQTRLQLKDPSNKNIQIYIWKQGGGSLTFKARWRKKDLRRKDAKAENKHWEGSPSESTGNSPLFQMGWGNINPIFKFWLRLRISAAKVKLEG